MKYDPVRWVCQFPADRCDGIFYVYGEARPCPLAAKCMAPGQRKTRWEYQYPQQSPDQRKLKLSDPQRYLDHAKRSCNLRRAFLGGSVDDPDHRYYEGHKDVILAKQADVYAEQSVRRAEDDKHHLPCGGDCRNCPYDDCIYEVQPRRPGPKPSLPEEELRALCERYSVGDISRLTGVSKKALWARCRRLKIPIIRVGKGGWRP